MMPNERISKPGLNAADDAPVKVARRGRPKGNATKVPVSLRLDKEALAAFRSTGPGWQGRINEMVMRSAKRLAVK